MKVKEIIKEMDTATASSTPKQYKITKQDQSGTTLVDLNDPKSSITISPDQQQSAFKPDPADPTKLTLDPNALAKSGATNQQASPTVGATVNVATALPGQVSATSGSSPAETMGSEDQTVEEAGEDTRMSPNRISELVRVASSGLSDPATGQFQNVYNPQDVARATEQLRQLGLNAQGTPLAGSQSKAPIVPLNPASKIGATEINESVELLDIKKLSGL